MRMPKMISFVAAPLVMVLLAPSAPAAPLDPSHIPSDAKWVIHVDFKALGETKLVEKVRENRRQLLFAARTWLQNRYGIDPREDLDSLTAFGSSYQAHTGTLILKANFDQQKVQARLEQKPNAQKISLGEYTVYSFPVTHPHPYNREASNKASANETERAAQEHARTINILLLDGKTMIVTAAPDRMRVAVDLVKGTATAVAKKDMPLLSKLSEGTIFYGAADKLGEITEHEGFFPILKQHEQIFTSVGVKNDQVFKELTLVAQTEDVAKNMKSFLEGMTALGKVWAADSENLEKLVENKEITCEGKTVQLKGHADSETVLKALDELGDRLAKRLEPITHNRENANSDNAKDNKNEENNDNDK